MDGTQAFKNHGLTHLLVYWLVVLSFQKNKPQNVVQQQYNILLLYSFQLKELGCRKVHADLAVLSYYNEGWEELSNISAAYNRPPTTRACRLQCTYYRPYRAGWLAGQLCSMLFHVLPRFYGLVIAKKWAQKLAPSQSLLAAALLPPTTTQWYQIEKIRQKLD